MGRTVNIRPGVGVLALFPHMNYKPWFALAEFVDNAVQSYFSKQLQLELADGEDFKLLVEITISPSGDRIIVQDNAAGIYADEYDRAFVTASPPPDANGLSQFGVGLKSASAWFGRHLKVESKALGEDVRRTLHLDYEKIVAEEQDDIDVDEVPADPNQHGTRLTLTGIHDMPKGRQITKIKDHLASIYRVFILDGRLDLRYNGDRLTYEEPAILVAPPAWDLDAPAVEWRKPIDVQLGNGRRVTGYAAVRERGSRSQAGFALFRHDRLVSGSGEDTYRPDEIFAGAGSFPFQRIIGDLHLDDFDVTHTKDGFRLEEDEEELIALLREALDAEPLPVLRQAWEYRAKPKPAEVKGDAEKAVARVGHVLETAGGEALATQAERQAAPHLDPQLNPIENATDLSTRRFDVSVADEQWVVTIDIAIDNGSQEWLQLADRVDEVGGKPHLGLRMNLASPFAVQYLRDASTDIEVFLRMAVALGLGEITARRAGVDGAALVRHNANELLAGPLSTP